MNGHEELPSLLTSREVAVLLRVSRAQVTQLAREGRLPAVRLSAKGDYRFRREDLLRLLAPVGGEPRS